MRSTYLALSLAMALSIAALQQNPTPAKQEVKQDKEPAAKSGASQSLALTLKGYETAKKFTLVAFGDLRITDTSNHSATDPDMRLALIKQIAQEDPAAIIISGDLPWHGSNNKDWQVYEDETKVWREKGTQLYPALGNHELSDNAQQGMENWWAHFPELKPARWYSARIGNCLLLTLDTNSKMGEGEPQTAWIKAQLAAIPNDVDFVIFSMHHPAYTDSHPSIEGGHSARKQEQEFGALLESQPPAVRAKLLVIAGHVHNYERFQHNGIFYLTSGGGGAQPYLFDRSADALFKAPKSPIYHYVKITVNGGSLKAQVFQCNITGNSTTFKLVDSFEMPAAGK